MLATLIVVLLAGILAPAAAEGVTSPGTLRVFAGGAGSGLGTNVGQTPIVVAMAGDRVLSVDGFAHASDVPPIDYPYPSVVRAIDPATGNQSLVAGDGLPGATGDGVATRSALGTADAAIGDAKGNVYIGESHKSRIRKVDASGYMQTIAGGDTSGFSGDGGPAKLASVYGPLGMALAPDGALVFSDAGNLRVRRIGTDGVITTVAGNGAYGSGGDGGPATFAQLSMPGALGFDALGNLYIADRLADRIRMVTPAGTISTFAQTPFPRGMAVSAPGRVLVTYGDTIRSITAGGSTEGVAGEQEAYGGFAGDGGPAIKAHLDGPRSVALDGKGNMYVADSGNRRIRRVDAGGIITTIAGNGTRSFGGDGGPARDARLLSPSTLRSGPGGLYVADRGNERVRRVDASGTISTVHASDAQGLAVDSGGSVYISETSRVIKESPDGTTTVVAGNGGAPHTGDGGPAVDAGISPQALALDGSGNLYIADADVDYTLIRRVDPSGVITTIAGADPRDREWKSPEIATHTSFQIRDMVVGSDGAIYLLRTGSVLRIRCGIVTDLLEGSNVDWDYGGYLPQALAVDRTGNLFIASGPRVQKVSPDGTVTAVAGGGSSTHDVDGVATDAALDVPIHGIAVGGAGSLYVTDRDRVMEVSGVSSGLATPGPACDVLPNRPVWGWGWNGLGALGDTSSPGRLRPDADYSPLTDTTSVAAGAFHSVALKADGTVWAWGWNGYGQLGDGSTVSHSTPTRVVGLSNVTAIAAGWVHNLAITADGGVWAWGWNNVGQLGDGSVATRLTPRRVANLGGVKGISASAYSSIATKSDGSVWAWGWNGFGQLGDGTTVERHLPVRVVALSGVKSAQAGVYHSLAVKGDGTVWSWGWNGHGQLGDGTTVDRRVPTRIGLGAARAAAAGAFHSLAVLDDGTVYSWGWNGHAQLGNYSDHNSATPVQSMNVDRVVAVSGGLAHSVALRDDGTVFGWGWGELGQLGTGQASRGWAPWAARALPHATSVSAGAGHTMAAFDLSDS